MTDRQTDRWTGCTPKVPFGFPSNGLKSRFFQFLEKHSILWYSITFFLRPVNLHDKKFLNDDSIATGIDSSLIEDRSLGIAMGECNTILSGYIGT